MKIGCDFGMPLQYCVVYDCGLPDASSCESHAPLVAYPGHISNPAGGHVIATSEQSKLTHDFLETSVSGTFWHLPCVTRQFASSPVHTSA